MSAIIFNLQDEFVQKKDQIDVAIFHLTTSTISLPIQQLFKYSHAFQKEYFNADIINKLSYKIQELQKLHLIKNENITIFFNLLNDEKVEITHDQYCDLCKLSDIFEVEPLQKCLNKYIKRYSKDIDFIIAIILEQNSEQIQYIITKDSFSNEMEDELSKNINKCLTNKNFGKLPISVINRIIEKSDLEKISHDHLFNFIEQSIKERYVLFSFLEIKKLSNDGINELFSNFEKNSNNKMYYQFLPNNLNYIRLLRNNIDELNLLVKKLKGENKLLKINEDDLKNQIQKMMNENLLFGDKIKQIENENYKLHEQNDQLIKENEQIRNEISKLKSQNQQVHIKNCELIKENEQIRNEINKLKSQNQKIHIKNCEITEENEQIRNEISKLKSENQQLSIQTQSENSKSYQNDANQKNFNNFENIYDKINENSDFFFLKKMLLQQENEHSNDIDETDNQQADVQDDQSEKEYHQTKPLKKTRKLKKRQKPKNMSKK